jgi:hypothetical protein
MLSRKPCPSAETLFQVHHGIFAILNDSLRTSVAKEIEDEQGVTVYVSESPKTDLSAALTHGKRSEPQSRSHVFQATSTLDIRV